MSKKSKPTQANSWGHQAPGRPLQKYYEEHPHPEKVRTGIDIRIEKTSQKGSK